MNIPEIYNAAVAFRNTIEVVSSSLGISFQSFPRGSCGDTVPMLGTYLIQQGLGEFQYMDGNYGNEAEGNWSSHGWLQSGNLVVDITADQFPEILEPVIVRMNSEWHNSLGGVSKGIGDYRRYDNRTVRKLGQLYAKIVEEINKTS